ncbi:hypothetical protein HPE56_07480 [Maribacter sp. ANRC-HE7]|uniref:PD-(D/E)XK nuclease superfamily protein n=1 Tax=Maribacter aquimaris TaxID=2737171 RepID=A0ABR7UYE7_9FLAO|nr:hypothetical protein [Maribacter aquimaris]MBD0777629.1 hypothetical protein [Maribacter aquimaris]
MQSLLGQFYNRIKGSQEDIASEGLVYILNQSLECRKAINQIVKANTNLKFSDLTYKTQNVGRDLERPDISGKDEEGKEVLIIEAKFWASLTSNQPNGYLKRLKDNTVLIFLVPTLRTRTVFEEVKNRILEEYINNDVDYNSDDLTIIIKPSQKHVFIKSWNEVLSMLRSKIEQANNITLLSDLNQIIGLCETIDQNSFQPIKDEDLSPRIPKNIVSYYHIVDKVVDELKNRNVEISIKGLVKTPQRYGYHRYFKTEKFGLNLALKLDLWEKYSDTPFWLSIQEIKERWTKTEELGYSLESLCAKSHHVLVDESNYLFVSLKPKLYVTEDIVIKDLANQIESILEVITKSR